MKFTLWTADTTLAKAADRAGVDRIGVDLETIGKFQRQSDRPTWVSPHQIQDLPRVSASLSNAELFTRCNGSHPGSGAELDAILAFGTQVVMLPNVTTLNEVERIQKLIDGRARLIVMVERVAAVGIIPNLPSLGVEEIHVGLNDLSIDLNLANRLAILGMPILDQIAEVAHMVNLQLGLGGIGRPMDTRLAVHSDLVYAQLGRLNASSTLISRSFFRNCPAGWSWLAKEITQAKARLAYWRSASSETLENARRELFRLATGAI